RDVRHVPHAGACLRRAALLREPRARQEADGEIRPGPGEVEGVEVERVELARALPDLLDPYLPRRGRIRLVEPADVRDVLPQPLERLCAVEARIHRLRPAEC